MGSDGGDTMSAPSVTIRSRMPVDARIWILTAFIAAAALGLTFHTYELRTLVVPLDIPWVAVAILFGAAEIFVVHLPFKKDAHSLTMSDIPLVLGLFFLTPQELVLSQVVGATVALLFIVKQPPIKAAFNIAQFALNATIAAFVFHTLLEFVDLRHPAGWATALAATCAASLVGIFATYAVISVSEGTLDWRQLPRSILFGISATFVNTSLGLVTVAVLWTSPEWSWLMLAPGAALVWAYKAYSSIRERHDGLEFLYEATRLIHQSPLFESAMWAVLKQTRTMFRSQVAEIVLLMPEEPGAALRTTVGPGDSIKLMKRVELDPADPLFQHVVGDQRTIALSRSSGGILERSGLVTPGIDGLMIAPLLGESGPIGTILVGDRETQTTSFRRADQKLFETLANHISVALEKSRLGQSLAQLQKLEGQLRHQALHDALTNLPNRWLFMDRVQVSLTRRNRQANSVAVLFIDLDDFKTYNDSLGHAAGDQLLKGVSDRLQQSLRPEDSAARLGGDEFAILIDDLSGREGATQVAQRIIEHLRQPLQLAGREVLINASVGIAINTGGEDADELLRNADVAMYIAKSEGKSRWSLFEPQMHTAVLQRMELKDHLQRAIERDQFEVFYQPIVDLRDGGLSGVEALVRWVHPERGFVEPVDFIPLAEETGLISGIDRWVLQEACRQAVVWQHEDPFLRGLGISVNLSTHQLHQKDIVDVVARSLRETGLDPSKLTLEITEGALMADTASTAEKLRALKDLGVRLAIDDFGTGHSSLAYLQHFPVDVLKIDKAFIDGIANGIEESALARAIIKIGDSLKLKTVAEGIELNEQCQELEDLGCDFGQGFLFAKPLRKAEISRLLGSVEMERATIR